VAPCHSACRRDKIREQPAAPDRWYGKTIRQDGDVTSVEVLARYIEAIGGRLEPTATFDDGTYRMGDATAAMRPD
jgi:hypothetical protein